MKRTVNTEQMPSFVKSYVRYLRTIQGRSESTIFEYFECVNEFLHYMNHYKLKNDLDSSIEFLDSDFLKSIDVNDIYEYLYHVDVDNSNNAKTRARKVSSLRSFFKFITNKEKIIENNPAVEIETPKTKKSLPKYLKLDETLKLLNSIDGQYKERDYAIILLFLTCGMRLSELVNININDIRGKELVITGKGNKERTVYLSDSCTEAIENYLKVRPIEGVKDKNALFISRQNNRISRELVQKTVSKYLEKAGLGDMKYSTHKLRHTAATLMYQEGHVDIRLLQEILGHSNLSTTEIYTHVSNKQLKEAIDSNPLANIKKD